MRKFIYVVMLTIMLLVMLVGAGLAANKWTECLPGICDNYREVYKSVKDNVTGEKDKVPHKLLVDNFYLVWSFDLEYFYYVNLPDLECGDGYVYRFVAGPEGLGELIGVDIPDDAGFEYGDHGKKIFGCAYPGGTWE